MPRIFKISSSRMLFLLAASIAIFSCNNSNNNKEAKLTDTTDGSAAVSYDTSFSVEAESFADLQILRYQVPGFNQLTLQQKQLAYYLYEAALCGRDIIYD